MNPILKHFLYILAAALCSAVLGALFGAAVAGLSPDLARSLFGPHTPAWRFAAGVGMIWGLFIGAGAMAFVIGISAISHWFRPPPANPPPS